jgi:hypothetical protein
MNLKIILNILNTKGNIKDKLSILRKMCFPLKIIKSSDESSPILFEEYNTKDYYYIVNKNKNNVYTIGELYRLVRQKVEDPFTRMKIVEYSFVKVKLV